MRPVPARLLEPFLLFDHGADAPMRGAIAEGSDR
jgi:hypothetical protein